MTEKSDKYLSHFKKSIGPANPLKKDIEANAAVVRSGVSTNRSAITALLVFSHVPRPIPYTTRYGMIKRHVPNASSLNKNRANPAKAKQRPPSVMTAS